MRFPLNAGVLRLGRRRCCCCVGRRRRFGSAAAAATAALAALRTGDVVVAQHLNVPVITLNRPNALNSLNLDMIRTLHTLLETYAGSSSVYSVVVQGAGDRAFCAGGDVKALYAEKASGASDALRREFFRAEYSLDYFIATFPKNYIALMDGITMGGGAGISMHSSFRVATNNTVFAMPETALGFFPDVGASYVLPRLPGELGTYLALTGASIRAADVKLAGVATHYIGSSSVAAVRDRILELEYDPESIDYAIRERSALSKDAAKSSELMQQMPLIDRCFAQDTVEGIVEALDASETQFGENTANKLRKVSPLSLKIALKQLRQGRTMTLEECFKMEYRIATHFMTRESDFFEGVRAVLVDKDNAAKWMHESIEAVPPETVDAFFQPIENELILSPAASST